MSEQIDREIRRRRKPGAPLSEVSYEGAEPFTGGGDVSGPRLLKRNTFL